MTCWEGGRRVATIEISHFTLVGNFESYQDETENCGDRTSGAPIRTGVRWVSGIVSYPPCEKLECKFKVYDRNPTLRSLLTPSRRGPEQHDGVVSAFRGDACLED